LVYFSQPFRPWAGIGYLSVIDFMILRIFACLCFLTLTLAAQTSSPTASARRSPKDAEAKEIKLGEDEPGCKDSMVLPRIPGCSIIQCDSKEDSTLELHIGLGADGVLQKESMDGASEVIYYLCPAKVSLGSIVKTSDSALVKAGFKTVFNGKDDEEHPVVTSMKETQWVQISTYMYNEYSAYILSNIKVDEDSQLSSDALAEEISKSGRVTLSGLQFEGDKADFPADAEKVMTEIAALLMRQPDWKIRVEAHARESATSEKRASAVASWLLEHGIDKTRLSVQGIAEFTVNQRVDLVRF
jgi:outer membrane protein OmpA-like peptidoglycan-associated protein